MNKLRGVDMTLGSRIKQLRAEKGVTQEDLGKVLNVGKSTISQYESNTNIPDLGMVNRIADYFNVTTDYLLGRTNNRNEVVDPTDTDIEEFLKRSNVQFDGAPLDDEDKEDVKNFLRMVMKRKK